MLFRSELEGISPVQVRISPVSTFAAAGCSRSATFGKNAQVVASLITPGAEVGGIVPQERSTDAHAGRNEVPQIPFT